MHSTFRGALGGLLLMTGSAAAAVTVTVNVPDVGTFQFFGNGNTSVTYDGVIFSTSAAFSDGNFFNVSPGFSGQAVPVLSSQQGSPGTLANILITLPTAAVSAFVTFSTFEGTAVNFLLSNGGLQSVGNAPGPALYGLTATYSTGPTSAFTTIQLTTSDTGLNIGSVTYSTDVPEPATWALMIGGFAMVGLTARRRRSVVVG